MQKATVIIGMNFGDEGKGHITNYFCDENTLNIRFNGGCQAAHAVFLSDGRSHIFKHFGSGSLRKARTLFTKHVILNPIIFAAEMKELSKKTGLREVFIDPRCRVTTPYDMLINEFSSWYKKSNSTTGFGINETVERSQYKQLRITARDLTDKTDSDLKELINKIQKEYLPWRFEQLKIPYDMFKSWLNADLDSITETYFSVIKEMLKFIVVWPDDNLIEKYLSKDPDRKLVFEGSQGFRLDQNRMELMPYLTRSNTGLQNVFECLSAVNTPIDMQVYLVTRSYLTRHGDGPLWNEVLKPYENAQDTTNIENSYQGKLRFGYLNKTWYDTSIKETQDSIMKNKPKYIQNIQLNVAMTHLDQLDNDEIIYSTDNEPSKFSTGHLDDFREVNLISKGQLETDISVKS